MCMNDVAENILTRRYTLIRQYYRTTKNFIKQQRRVTRVNSTFQLASQEKQSTKLTQLRWKNEQMKQAHEKLTRNAIEATEYMKKLFS